MPVDLKAFEELEFFCLPLRYPELMAQAAHEIKTLRAENEKLKEMCSESHKQYQELVKEKIDVEEDCIEQEIQIAALAAKIEAEDLKVEGK